MRGAFTYNDVRPAARVGEPNAYFRSSVQDFEERLDTARNLSPNAYNVPTATNHHCLDLWNN